MPPGQRPGGSRTPRPPYASLQPGQPHPQMARPSSRNAAFENIFGRPSAGHHLGGNGGGSGAGGGGMGPGAHGPPLAARNPYPGAPSFPPQNHAQPGFPPVQPQSQPPPPPPPFSAHPAPQGAPNPYSNYPAEAYRAPVQQQGYDTSNGAFGAQRGQGYQSVSCRWRRTGLHRRRPLFFPFRLGPARRERGSFRGLTDFVRRRRSSRSRPPMPSRTAGRR